MSSNLPKTACETVITTKPYSFSIAGGQGLSGEKNLNVRNNSQEEETYKI